MKRSYGLIHFGHENIIYFIFYMVEVETEALKAYVFLHSESNLITSIALVSRCFDLRLAKKLMIGATSLDNMKQNHKQLCRGRMSFTHALSRA